MTISKKTNIPLGTYLFKRLAQVNHLKSVFGVPGDFNLPLLEHIYNVPELNWIGTCNELNAGYAADGYARLNGLGAVITTFGVGELSVLNAVSGAFTEGAGVLSIVGTSPSRLKDSKDIALHHLIPNKNTWEVQQDHYVYEKLVEPFSCAVESITDSDLDNIQDQIDNVIESVYKHSRPGYIFLPVNLADLVIPINEEKHLNLHKYSYIDDGASYQKINSIASKALDKIYNSRNFAVLADVWIKSRKEALNKFISQNNIHCFGGFLAKSVLDETLPNFHGLFGGELSTQGTVDDLSNFVLVLHLGPVFNEVNNFGNAHIKDHVPDVIEVGKDYIRLDGELQTNIDGVAVFDQILQTIETYKIPRDESIPNLFKSNKLSQTQISTTKLSSKITQKSLRSAFESQLKPNDIIVCEMCSFLFALPDVSFPTNTTLISQSFYGSIGYALPATLGASLYARDSNHKGRVVLVEGDGSSQMTIQELSSFIRHGLDPTILLLNNEGYSVERIVLGATRHYNDIQPDWQYCELLRVFGDINGDKSYSTKVETVNQLKDALDKETGERLKFIEVVLDKMDVPWRFNLLCGKPKPVES